MQAVARQVGESELVATLFPLSVDGLAVVASVALVEVNRRIARPPPPVRAVGQVLVEEPPAPVEVPAARGGGPVFVPPVVGASSPAPNGSGSINHSTRIAKDRTRAFLPH
jgi:hypothetical protein